MRIPQQDTISVPDYPINTGLSQATSELGCLTQFTPGGSLEHKPGTSRVPSRAVKQPSQQRPAPAARAAPENGQRPPVPRSTDVTYLMALRYVTSHIPHTQVH